MYHTCGVVRFACSVLKLQNSVDTEQLKHDVGDYAFKL